MRFSISTLRVFVLTCISIGQVNCSLFFAEGKDGDVIDDSAGSDTSNGPGTGTGDGLVEPLNFLAPVDCGGFKAYQSGSERDFIPGETLWNDSESEDSVLGDGRIVVLRSNKRSVTSSDNYFSSAIQSKKVRVSNQMAFDLVSKLNEKHVDDRYQLSMEIKFYDVEAEQTAIPRFVVHINPDSIDTWTCVVNPTSDTVEGDDALSCAGERLSLSSYLERGLDQIQIQKSGLSIKLVHIDEYGAYHELLRNMSTDYNFATIRITASRRPAELDASIEDINVLELGSACQ